MKTGCGRRDKSGDRLREWLGVDRAPLHSGLFAVIPMDLFPGHGKSHSLAKGFQKSGILNSQGVSGVADPVIGQYAQKAHLHEKVSGR